jgi:hypothetical protein
MNTKKNNERNGKKTNDKENENEKEKEKENESENENETEKENESEGNPDDEWHTALASPSRGGLLMRRVIVMTREMLDDGELLLLTCLRKPASLPHLRWSRVRFVSSNSSSRG